MIIQKWRSLAQFTITGKITPKARPRVTRTGRAYLPKEYCDCRNRIQAQLLRQSAIAIPLEVASVSLGFSGAYPRADADNIIGTVLDAMVAADILKNDSVKYVPVIHAYYVGAGDYTAVLDIAVPQ